MKAANATQQYQPGEVMVLTTDGRGDVVTESSDPYSRMVAGIYSTKPGYIGRRYAAAQAAGEVPLAMAGVVPTKVTTENGPINHGDLLVTSSRRGYAMKGSDSGRPIGAVVGKAMGSLDNETGVIDVLVSLQ